MMRKRGKERQKGGKKWHVLDLKFKISSCENFPGDLAVSTCPIGRGRRGEGRGRGENKEGGGERN